LIIARSVQFQDSHSAEGVQGRFVAEQLLVLYEEKTNMLTVSKNGSILGSCHFGAVTCMPLAVQQLLNIQHAASTQVSSFLTMSSSSTPTAKASSPLQKRRFLGSKSLPQNSDWLTPSILTARTVTAAAECLPFPYVKGVFGTVVILLETVEVRIMILLRNICLICSYRKCRRIGMI
jgi:hypothetical protein